MSLIQKNLFIIIIFSLTFFNCGVPKQEDDFLSVPKEEKEYSIVVQRGDSLLYARLNDLIAEINRIKNELEELKKAYNELAEIVKGIQEDIKKLSDLPGSYEELAERVKDLEEKNAELDDKLAKLEQELGDNQKNLNTKKDDKPTNVDFGLFNIDKAIMSLSKPILSTADFLENYKNAINLFRSKRYDYSLKALDKLQQSKYKVDDLEDNIIYWLGECSYGKKNYDEAVKFFSKILELPNSNKSEDALIMLGNTFEKMGEIEPAREAYQRLLEEYPNGKYESRAKSKLRTLI